jgi:hypothetical protein
MLCTLLNELAQLAQHKQARRQAQVPFGQGTSKAARKRAAKQRAETRSKAAFRRRLEFYDAMRALNGPHVRQAIEAAPVRIALTAGQSEA